MWFNTLLVVGVVPFNVGVRVFPCLAEPRGEVQSGGVIVVLGAGVEKWFKAASGGSASMHKTQHNPFEPVNVSNTKAIVRPQSKRRGVVGLATVLVVERVVAEREAKVDEEALTARGG